MKNYITYAILFLLVSNGFSQGITFQSENWKQILAEAKEKDQLIFLDAYTTWCGPCKYMSREVFTDEKVATFYNDNFVNAKFDMEKGEGLKLAELYEVKAYPTLLYINGEGDVVHKALGGRGVENFIGVGEAANNPDLQLLSLETKYNNGDLSDDVLLAYANALKEAGSSQYEEVASIYLNDKDWTTEENIKFLFEYSNPTIDSKLFAYSVANKQAFNEVVGEAEMNQKVEYAAKMDARLKMVNVNDLDEYTMHLFKYYDDATATRMAKKGYIESLMYSDDTTDKEKFKVEAQLFLSSEPEMPWNFYNAVAWECHVLTKDRMLLEKCSRWADISINSQENSYNTDTKAAIEYKLGNKIEAKKWATKSISLAKVDGADSSETQALLEKIDAL